MAADLVAKYSEARRQWSIALGILRGNYFQTRIICKLRLDERMKTFSGRQNFPFLETIGRFAPTV